MDFTRQRRRISIEEIRQALKMALGRSIHVSRSCRLSAPGLKARKASSGEGKHLEDLDFLTNLKEEREYDFSLSWFLTVFLVSWSKWWMRINARRKDFSWDLRMSKKEERRDFKEEGRLMWD